MQAMPDARQQSFEEIYGPPENFLEIEVGSSLRWFLLSSPWADQNLRLVRSEIR